MDEVALLAQIAKGSREAFEAFYRFHEQRLYRYLYGLVREQTVAEELVVDVMLEVWRGAGRFRGASKVSTWLIGIARHKALTLMRRRPLPTDPVEEVAATLDAPGVDPLGQLEESEKAQQVRQALQALSSEHREVLELAFAHALSYQEIAGLVGIPVNTVKTRVYYAKQQLKRILEPLGLQEEKV